MDRAPERIATARQMLMRPIAGDAEEIFRRYASDDEVTRYLGWPRHRTIADTQMFLGFSNSEWTTWPAGPYLVRSNTTGEVLGATGLSFETPLRAMTGYAFARDAWGMGHATESLEAMVALAHDLGVVRLYALCHPEHRASVRVLEKCGFSLEGIWRQHMVFPNIDVSKPADVLCYTVITADR